MQYHNEATDTLFRGIMSLKTIEECSAFFDDLCTIQEIRDMAQRLEVAQLLSSGKTYQEVAAKTGVSTATIGRVKKCLEYGPGGYAAVLERLKEAPENRK